MSEQKQDKQAEEVVDVAAEQQAENTATEAVVEEIVEEIVEEVVEGEVEQQVDLAAQLEQAQQEIAELKDSSLRVQAEAQNIRRRSEGEVDKARKFALEKFAGELLPVMDNLERALEASAEEHVAAAMEGVELTRKNLEDVFKRFKIEGVNPAGEPFDPQAHQAMSMIENPDCEPNTVLHVVQKGYNLNGRLLRPAMVMVSKAADKGA
ncbi:molecular chaperone GrpE [Sinobacterium caligoides]|uniref:Protein GrpE n=1 Tax=Sinobacterium caligoides TaxID=933926 RepID=A0A3N2DG76_9GAMM|nr:nucleotide exchange factor GrpE [Sinobacterium caligoides]ROR98658.1 molecular chaperone GrpE [Sinobacterium caligoides]